MNENGSPQQRGGAVPTKQKGSDPLRNSIGSGHAVSHK